MLRQWRRFQVWWRERRIQRLSRLLNTNVRESERYWHVQAGLRDDRIRELEAEVSKLKNTLAISENDRELLLLINQRERERVSAEISRYVNQQGVVSD